MINVNYAAQASAPIPVAAALPQVWIDALMSNRWNYRRAAMLYALANMDGPALLAAYRLANQYRIVMDRTENDLLDRIAMKINGHPVGLGSAYEAAGLANNLLQRGYLYAVQTGALAPHTMPVPTYAMNREVVPRQWPGASKCRCGGACGCNGGPRRVGLGFADEGSGASSAGNFGGEAGGEAGGGWGSDMPWGGDTPRGGAMPPGTEGDGWGSDMPWGGDTPRGGAMPPGTESSAGSDPWGGDAWGGTESAGEGATADPSDPFGSWGSTPSTPKKPPASSPGAKNWWDAIPATLKAATDTATRAYCLANPSNAACGSIPQNSPQWIAYCRTNPAYPPCATLLQQAGIPPASGAFVPPPVASQEVPGWVWGVGAVALIALALLLL